ncbi:MAG: hypothetical protein CO128_07000 [Ignavibacteriales bacterium CG_4_9_14_3_um_filter_30_11]|nr:MAG: hypothetical protein CO128_07000 [Ignavibacteriales bacterium CG_4_9_14_3_um_filter_30_11]
MRKNIHIVILSILFSIVLWVSITLSNDYYITYNFPLTLVDFPAGYASGVEIPKEISVKLKGKGWKLFGFNIGSRSYYRVSVGSGSGYKALNLATYMGENPWLSSDVEILNIQPKTININLEKTITKKLEIIPQLKLDFKSGYGLATSIKLLVDSVEVIGPKSVMNTLNSIPTKDIVLSSLDKVTQIEASLIDIEGVSYSVNRTIINLDVQKIVEKSIKDLNVAVLNVPSNRELVLLPNIITISVRGGIDVLGKLDRSQFIATVDYKEIVNDTLGSIIPNILLPDNTTLLFTQPERIQFVIKKY